MKWTNILWVFYKREREKETLTHSHQHCSRLFVVLSDFHNFLLKETCLLFRIWWFSNVGINSIHILSICDVSFSHFLYHSFDALKWRMSPWNANVRSPSALLVTLDRVKKNLKTFYELIWNVTHGRCSRKVRFAKIQCFLLFLVVAVSLQRDCSNDQPTDRPKEHFCDNKIYFLCIITHIVCSFIHVHVFPSMDETNPSNLFAKVFFSLSLYTHIHIFVSLMISRMKWTWLKIWCCIASMMVRQMEYVVWYLIYAMCFCCIFGSSTKLLRSTKKNILDLTHDHHHHNQ